MKCTHINIFLFFSIFLRLYAWYGPNLPEEHIALYYNKNKSALRECMEDFSCKHKIHLNHELCWGYEMSCEKINQYSSPTCPGDPEGWVNSKVKQVKLFYEQADFGYIKKQKNSLIMICEPNGKSSISWLKCSAHLEFCHGKNIWIDLRKLVGRTDNMKYKTDILSPGQLGGLCELNDSLRQLHSDRPGVLQSWAPELRNFISLKDFSCDIIIKEPVYLMKLDATVSLYHHFCDFLNLYASLHLNDSYPPNPDSFVLLWENQKYISNFGRTTFSAFTNNAVKTLTDVMGKRLCLHDVVFPLLPRAIYGLYYNTPLIPGCHNSGLFHAFNRFILHKLKIIRKYKSSRIRITFLSRLTQYRKILNEAELIAALHSTKKYDVNHVKFHWNTPFLKQLDIIHNTDVLIGIHGSGLTHLLFLPDWAAVFELYNCGDEHCYKDLARLRGVHYVTWSNMSKLYPQDLGRHPQTEAAHEKFTNYKFDVDEFLYLVSFAAQLVKSHYSWNTHRSKRKHEL